MFPVARERARFSLVLRFSFGLAGVAAMLFLTAGSLRYWQGWIFLSVVFIPGISSIFYFYKHDPPLIERRLQSNEKVGEQKLLIKLWKPLLLVAFLLRASITGLAGREPRWASCQPGWNCFFRHSF